MENSNFENTVVETISQYVDTYIKELKDVVQDGEQGIFAVKAKMISNLKQHARPPITIELVEKIATEIFSLAVSVVKPIKVAYLGPIGTFTHIALLEIFGDAIEAIAHRTISDVFDEVETSRATFGVVPIENTTEGAVTYTMDEFLETDLNIVSEKYLRITYSLLSVCDNIDKIKKVYSHPQSLAQCKNWLKANVPNVEIIQLNSTAKAAETASWDKYSAAIASTISAKIYNLNIIADGIEDSRQNFTRFLVLGKHANPPSKNDKTSIVCAVKDQPGALYKLLKPFSDHGINMTMIESRPDKRKMWAYNFFIDFMGHKTDPVVQEALENMKQETIFLKILGSYEAEKHE
ncbi:MAG TPA: prephenate dehydratase [Spirochaetota bacterium]|nr:prephenate dehydratase [Spirochaetota bacterium]